MESAVGNRLRVSVGTHYRVWWFWLPIIIGCLALMAAGLLLPMRPRLGGRVTALAIACFLVALIAWLMIVRGRRWVELEENSFRLFDRNTVEVIADEQVTDVAWFRQPHHGAGKLLAETRQLILWVTTDNGPRQLRLSSRMSPGAWDPLQPLVDRLCRRLADEATWRLSAGKPVDGEGWRLNTEHLQIHSREAAQQIPLEELAAVEQIGHEVRFWRAGRPQVAARLPLSGRNGWLIEPLLRARLLSQSTMETSDEPAAGTVGPADVGLGELQSPVGRLSGPPGGVPLGRILFERAAGPGATVLFGVLGLLMGSLGGLCLWGALRGLDPIMAALGGLLMLLCGVCLAAGLRLRHVRFRCYERGLERISLTGHRVLPFSEIDVFSCETRRNQSHGRYTGTTYTLVFADRSREQGRGIFYSTTVRNHDLELDDLRDRVSHIIARRMARTFATHRSVQWTPEVWFQRDVLEYTRRRRWFVPSKVVVVPYDTIIDFDLRDGTLHIWASYQQRAVLSLPAGAPNFYAGLILLEGLVGRRHPVTETAIA